MKNYCPKKVSENLVVHPWYSIPVPRIDARSYSCVIDDDEARDITAGQAGIMDTVVSS